MNIWLIYPYGYIPGEGKRPDRAFMIAEALVAHGHSVTWWASAFDHANKKFRTKEITNLKISSKFTIRLVPTSGYKKNISFGRILHEKRYAKNIYKISNDIDPPDVIVLSEPALFRSKPILRLVSKHKSKLVLDILDLWPEIFNIVIPSYFKFIGNFIFKPWFKRRKNLFAKANAVVAVSESYIDLAKKINPNIPNELTETVYFGTNILAYRDEMNSSEELPEIFNNFKKNKDDIWVIYASTLGSNYDVKTLLKAAKLIESGNKNLKLLIAGEGPLRKDIVSFIKSNNLNKTIYIGNPNSKKMAKIYSFCDIGLSMYLDDSSVTFPIKAFHYFAAGLPIINSLEGDLCKLLMKHNAGIQYSAENHESLFQALNMLSSDKNKLKEMSKNSYNLAMNFDQNNQYKKFRRILDKVSIGI